MNTDPTPNLLMEAIAYLGNRATDYRMVDLGERMRDRAPDAYASFMQAFGPVEEILRELDRTITVQDRQLAENFRDIPGFPFTSISGYSKALLITYPIPEGNVDLDVFFRHKENRDREQICRSLLLALGFEREVETCTGDFRDLYTECVQTLDVPDASKLTLLSLPGKNRQILAEIEPVLRAVVSMLAGKMDALVRVAEDFLERFRRPENERYMAEAHGFVGGGEDVTFYPFILGGDTSVKVNLYMRERNSYCFVGIFRDLLMQAIATDPLHLRTIVGMYKLLTKPKMMEILQYLSRKDAYIMEMSEELELCRQTLENHILDLQNAGFIRSVVEDARVYYCLDRMALRHFLDMQHSAFGLDGTSAPPQPE